MWHGEGRAAGAAEHCQYLYTAKRLLKSMCVLYVRVRATCPPSPPLVPSTDGMSELVPGYRRTRTPSTTRESWRRCTRAPCSRRCTTRRRRGSPLNVNKSKENGDKWWNFVYVSIQISYSDRSIDRSVGSDAANHFCPQMKCWNFIVSYEMTSHKDITERAVLRSEVSRKEAKSMVRIL